VLCPGVGGDGKGLAQDCALAVGEGVVTFPRRPDLRRVMNTANEEVTLTPACGLALPLRSTGG